MTMTLKRVSYCALILFRNFDKRHGTLRYAKQFCPAAFRSLYLIQSFYLTL
jgi:hypothetical protein